MGNLAHKYKQQVEHQQLEQSVMISKRRKKFSKGEKGLSILFLVVILAFVGMIIANQARIYSMDRDIYKLERQIEAQAEVNQALQLQVIELSAPDRILHIATEQLGMTLDDNKVKVVQN